MTPVPSHSSSAVPVIRALGTAAEQTPADVIADALPLEGTGLDVVEVLVPEGSPLHGRALREVPGPDGARRGGRPRQ